MMAAVEENWQTKQSTVLERTTFIFNNELLSDVKFVVPVSTGDSESKKVTPAHKFVLAIGSPVFFAMFYGQMAETTDSIELPDCDYKSLLELFRFLYSDEVNLTGSNVMQVLYLANKYMVPSLVGKCTEYLADNLKASNVFCILPHAQKFKEKDLEDRCWEVIEMQTKQAISSDEFVTLERSLVESVVKREKLNVKEVELFKAVDRWAIKECKRQGVTPDGVVKRRILGEEVIKAIRFPLMSEKEFVLHVFDCNILTSKELSDMMKHYNHVLKSTLTFTKTPRIASVHRCYRFAKFSPQNTYWNYWSKPDCISFTVNKPIKLLGVQHYGCEGGKYTVSTELKDIINDSSLVKQSGTYVSEEDDINDYHGFDVFFNRPVCLEENKKYKLVSIFEGPVSWSGKQGQKTVECEGVQFTFTDFLSSLGGQFPAFVFSLTIPNNA
ncbi:hypothetical protein ACROYT_G038488 [Oculina patagonica]